MLKPFESFIADERGATAVEYGLIVALVSVVGISALALMGDSLIVIFTKIATEIQNAL